MYGHSTLTSVKVRREDEAAGGLRSRFPLKGVHMRLFGKRLSGGQKYERRPGRSQDQRPAPMRDGMRFKLLGGPVGLNVVGESYYQENLWQPVTRIPAVRVPAGLVTGLFRAARAAAPSAGSWLIRWTSSRRLLAVKPISFSSGR